MNKEEGKWNLRKNQPRQGEESQDENDPAGEEEEQREQIIENGSVTMRKAKHVIHCLTIVGQIEGHYILPPQNKTTKYEHVIPQLVAIEQDPQIEGLLIILNTVGGDVEAGLAIAELISGMKKPAVSLVLGGGHSIGVPLACSARQSFIAPSATMTIHPVRMNGLVLGVPQTLSYFDKMQERIVRFVVDNSGISSEDFRRLMEAGVTRYHANLETSRRNFPNICTTHSYQDKIDNIRRAKQAGLQICSGGIVGLGETWEDRLELALDLAELEATLPDVLADFSRSTAKLIREQSYQTVSNARSGAREFAPSSRIDQVDLVHLAKNLGTKEGEALSKVLLSAVKYNRTSADMTNAYGLSIYFPYRKTAAVSRAASTFERIGMDDAYTQCIRQFADVVDSGQAVSGGSDSPLPALL